MQSLHLNFNYEKSPEENGIQKSAGEVKPVEKNTEGNNEIVNQLKEIMNASNDEELLQKVKDLKEDYNLLLAKYKTNVNDTKPLLEKPIEDEEVTNKVNEYMKMYAQNKSN